MHAIIEPAVVPCIPIHPEIKQKKHAFYEATFVGEKSECRYWPIAVTVTPSKDFFV